MSAILPINLDPILVDERRESFCSSINRKICEAVASCFSCFRKSNEELSDPFLLNPPEERKRVSPYLTAATLFSAASVTTSAILLSSVINEVAVNCFTAEMQSQDAFNQCNKPYEKPLILHHSLLSVSSIFLGYILQRIWEQDSASEASLSDTSIWTKVKDKVALVQNKYRYEGLLLLTYFYNGIGINVSDVSSFKDFLNCGAAGISLGSAIVGMYARQQFVNIQRKSWLSHNSLPVHTSNCWKIGTLTSVAATVLVITAIPGTSMPETATDTARTISLMVICQPLGFIAARWLDQDRSNVIPSFKEKMISGLSATLSLQTPLALAGYCIYLIPSTLPSKLIGMSLIGFTQGVKHFRNKNQNEVSIGVNSSSNSAPFRIKQFMKDYWSTAALIIFSSTLAKFRFLDCQGPPSIFNYSCPIGLELSGYLAGNQVLIDSTGVNVVITTGMLHYYARRLFRKMQNQEHCTKIIARNYLQITNTLQFPLLSLLPYALIQSGNSSDSFIDFYRYNPITPLVFMGITFGTYKENVYHTAQSDASLT